MSKKIKRDERVARIAKEAFNSNLFMDNYEPPSNYGISQLILMVRDPYSIYAYWEIAPVSLSTLKRKVSKKKINSGKSCIKIIRCTYDKY